jgi:hypothetical protein
VRRVHTVTSFTHGQTTRDSLSEVDSENGQHGGGSVVDALWKAKKSHCTVWRTKIAQFRTHYLTKELECVSTQQSGQVTMDTEMIEKKCVELA